MGQREPLRMAADGAGRAPPRRSHPAPRWAAWRTSRPAAWRPPAQRRRLQPALLAAMPLVPVCGDSCAAGMLHSLHPAKPPVEAAAASICCRKCFSQLVANALPVPFVALQPGELAGRQHGYGRVWWGGRAGRAPWTCATRRARGPWPRAAWGQSPGRSARSGPGTTQTAPAPPPRRVIRVFGAPAGRSGPACDPAARDTLRAAQGACGAAGGAAAGLQVAVALLAQDVADQQLQLRARDDLLRVQVEALEEVLVRLAAAHPAPRARAPGVSAPPMCPAARPARLSAQGVGAVQRRRADLLSIQAAGSSRAVTGAHTPTAVAPTRQPQAAAAPKSHPAAPRAHISRHMRLNCCQAVTGAV